MIERKGEPSPDDRNLPVQLIPAAQSLPAARDGYGPGYGYGGVVQEGREAPGLDLFEYWRILNKRKGLILGLAGAVVALGVLATLMKTPVYTSTIRLQIDRNVAKVIEGGAVNPVEGTDFEFLKTQYELLQSRAMAERIASGLRLGDDPNFLKSPGFSLLGFLANLFKSPSPAVSDKKTLEHRAAAIILDNRSVRPVAGSRLVDLTYTDPTPSRAQKIAEAFARAFMDSNVDKRFQANAYAKTFLEDQLKQLKARLEDSEKTLLDFAQKEQIVVVTEKASIAENNLAAANSALGNLVSERIKNEQLWKQVDAANGMNLPQLLTNSVIDGLRGRRSALVTEYQEKSETFRPGYPAMVQISNKIAEIDRQINSEVQAIKGSHKAAYESSLSQEEEMRKRIETLRGDVIDLQKRSIQYNILKREVDTTRSLYEGLLQRYKEVDVAGGVASNNVFIVDRADLPETPSSPKMLRTILLCLTLGLGAGAAVAILLERLDDRISSVETLEKISGLTTIGVIPKIEGDSLEAQLADPRSPLSEAYRSLCTALQFSTDTGLPKTLFFTSAGPAEGKSSTSLAVARHFAALGLKVLAIDADLRKPTLHTKIGCSNELGLSNYLTGGCRTEDAFKMLSPSFYFMASGPLPPNAADLLSSSRLSSLLSVGAEVFDLIVIDGPPVLGLADAQLLSSTASATIFVAAAAQARTGEVNGALRRLQMARGFIIGAVLTKFNPKAAGYGYGYHQAYARYGEAVQDSTGQRLRLSNGKEHS